MIFIKKVNNYNIYRESPENLLLPPTPEFCLVDARYDVDPEIKHVEIRVDSLENAIRVASGKAIDIKKYNTWYYFRVRFNVGAL